MSKTIRTGKLETALQFIETTARINEENAVKGDSEEVTTYFKGLAAGLRQAADYIWNYVLGDAKPGPEEKGD